MCIRDSYRNEKINIGIGQKFRRINSSLQDNLDLTEFFFDVPLESGYSIFALGQRDNETDKFIESFQNMTNALSYIYFNDNSVKSYNVEQARESIEIIYKNIIHYSNLFNHVGKITLIGFSQGAILSWALGINYTSKINKLVLLSGYFNDELINNTSNELKELICFISHGIYDQVIPIEVARDSSKEMG